MKSKPVRVRYAPSPTGHLHLGSLRTALFNWLFARHHEGTYVVRIEDTDFERSRPAFTHSILESLAWCQLESDEPLIYQSQSGPVYAQVAQQLLATGAVYRCYCTQEEVRNRVHAVAADGTEYFFYDGACRDRQDQPDKPFVLRVRVPRTTQAIVVQDLIHGAMSFSRDTIDDFVIVRSDGSPMYNFTVVVDDARMNISHVIRGDDHIINTPRQIILYEACGYSLPFFAHVPLLLGPGGKKLSKRDAATAVADYRSMGFLPSALCNYLVRLGWSHGDCEIIARDALVKIFSLEQVGSKPALFDTQKLLWMNSVYLKAAAPETIIRSIEQDIDIDFQTACALLSAEQLRAAVRLYQERSKTLCELHDAITHLCKRPEKYSIDLALQGEQRNALRLFIQRLTPTMNAESVKQLIKTVAAECHLSFADLGLPLRVALTGTTAAPSIAELVVVLGSLETCARIEQIL